MSNYNSDTLVAILKVLKDTHVGVPVEVAMRLKLKGYYHAREVAEILGISVQKASAYLSHLYELRMVNYDRSVKLTANTEGSRAYWRILR